MGYVTCESSQTIDAASGGVRGAAQIATVPVQDGDLELQLEVLGTFLRLAEVEYCWLEHQGHGPSEMVRLTSTINRLSGQLEDLEGAQWAMIFAQVRVPAWR